MQDLNKRFEFYILQQREKDAATNGLEGDLEELRVQYAEETRKMRAIHAEQKKMYEKQRNQDENKLHDTSQELASVLANIQRLESRQALHTSQVREYQGTLEHLVGKNKDLRETLFEVQNRARELERSCDAHAAHCSDLERTVPTVQQALEGVAESTQSERELAVQLRSDLAEIKDKAERDRLNHLREIPVLQDRHATTAKQKDQRRRQKMIDDLKTQNEARTKANVDTMKYRYEAKAEQFRLHIESQLAERASLETEKKDLDAIEARIRNLQDTCAGLKDDLATARATQEQELSGINADIANVKARAKRKMKQHDELMEIKLPFDVELQQLEEILSTEEKRLGISRHGSPLKKQKTKEPKSAAVPTRSSSRLNKDKDKQ